MTRRFRLCLIAVWATLVLVPPGPLQAQSFFEGIFSKAKRGIQKVVTPEPKREIRVTKEVKATKWQPKWLIRPTLSKETLLLAECSRQPPFPFSTFRYYDEIEQLPRSTQPLTVPSFGPSISIEEEGSEHPENPLDSTKLTPIFSHPDDQWIRHEDFPEGKISLTDWFATLLRGNKTLLGNQGTGHIVDFYSFTGTIAGMEELSYYQPANEKEAFLIETYRIMFPFLKTLLQPSNLRPVEKPEEFFTDEDHQNTLGCRSALDQDKIYETDWRPLFAYGSLPRHVDVALSYNYCERPVIILDRRHFPVDDPIKLSILFQAYLIAFYQNMGSIKLDDPVVTAMSSLFNDSKKSFGYVGGHPSRDERIRVSLFGGFLVDPRFSYFPPPTGHPRGHDGRSEEWQNWERKHREFWKFDDLLLYDLDGHFWKWDYLRQNRFGGDGPLVFEAERYKLMSSTHLQQALFFQTLLNLEELAPFNYYRGFRRVRMRSYATPDRTYYDLSETLHRWANALTADQGALKDGLFQDIGDTTFCFYRWGQTTGRCGYKCITDIAFNRIKRYGSCGGVRAPAMPPPGTGQVRVGLAAEQGMSPSQALTAEEREGIIRLIESTLQGVREHLSQEGSFRDSHPRVFMKVLERNLECFVAYLNEQSPRGCDHSPLGGGIAFGEGVGAARYRPNLRMIEVDPEVRGEPLEFSKALLHEYLHGTFERFRVSTPSKGAFSAANEFNSYLGAAALDEYSDMPFFGPTENPFLDEIAAELNNRLASGELSTDQLWFRDTVFGGNFAFAKGFRERVHELAGMLDTDGQDLYPILWKEGSVDDREIILDYVAGEAWDAYKESERATGEQIRLFHRYRLAQKDAYCGEHPSECRTACREVPPDLMSYCRNYYAERDAECDPKGGGGCGHCIVNETYTSGPCTAYRREQERYERKRRETERDWEDAKRGGRGGRGAGGGERQSQTERTSRPSDGGGSSGGSSEASGRPCVGGYICIIVEE